MSPAAQNPNRRVDRPPAQASPMAAPMPTPEPLPAPSVPPVQGMKALPAESKAKPAHGEKPARPATRANN